MSARGRSLPRRWYSSNRTNRLVHASHTSDNSTPRFTFRAVLMLFSCMHDKVGLKCPSVRPSVRPSTKSFFEFNEIWYAGRGRRVMHDGIQCYPIQGQGQSHEPLNVGNLAIFKCYLLPHLQWELANDHGFLNWGQYLQLVGTGFLIFVLVFVSCD